MKYVTIVLAALLLSACASPTLTELRAPDGTAMKNVKCPADPQRCFEVASESCRSTGGTYQVVRSHSNAGGTMADIMPGPVTWYNMTYVCGPSDGRLPDFAFQGQTFDPGPAVIYQPQPQQRLRTICSTHGGVTSCTTR